jgi:hypothetical protein
VSRPQLRGRIDRKAYLLIADVRVALPRVIAANGRLFIHLKKQPEQIADEQQVPLLHSAFKRGSS